MFFKIIHLNHREADECRFLIGLFKKMTRQLMQKKRTFTVTTHKSGFEVPQSKNGEQLNHLLSLRVPAAKKSELS